MLIECGFKTEKGNDLLYYSRRLNSSKYEQLCEQALQTNFDCPEPASSEDKILFLLDRIAPLKKVKKNKKIKQLSWFDSDLRRAKSVCDKLYAKYTRPNSKNASIVIKEEFLSSRQAYQSLLKKN